MSGVWYQDYGYHIAYTAAFWLFAAIAWRRLAHRRVAAAWGHLLALTWLTSMLLYAHVAHWLVVRRSWANRGLERFYEDRSGDLGADLGGLLETLAGLWGGPLLVVATVLFAVLAVRESEGARRDVLDAAALGLPFGLAMAKVGCLVAGCCHGFECSSPPGLTFSWVAENSESHGRTLFPTQLLDVGLFGLCGLALVWMARRGSQRGRLLDWFVLLGGIGRFLSEFTRGDGDGPVLLGLSTVQLVLLVAVPWAGLMLVRGALFDRLLARRAPFEPCPAPEPRRADLLLRVTLVLAFPLYPLTPLLAPLALVLAPWPLLRLLAGRQDPVTWNQLLVLYTLAGLALAFVVCMLVVPLWPALLFGVLFLAGWLALLQRRLQAPEGSPTAPGSPR